jgi:tetratricopeptide (TPR) repeat protein
VALGNAVLEGGDAAAAAQHFRQAISQNNRLAEAYSGLGRAQTLLNQFDEARGSLARAIELVPNSQATMLALADLLATTGQHDDALDKYREAADLNPADPTPLLRAAALALRLSRDVYAAAFLDRLLDEHPNLAAGLALYGDVMRARSDRAAAIGYYERALGGTGPLERPQIQAAIEEMRRPPPRRRHPR